MNLSLFANRNSNKPHSKHGIFHSNIFYVYLKYLLQWHISEIFVCLFNAKPFLPLKMELWTRNKTRYKTHAIINS